MKYYNNYFHNTGNVIGEWKTEEITAVLKPGKPKDTAGSYRPILLLVYV